MTGARTRTIITERETGKLMRKYYVQLYNNKF